MPRSGVQRRAFLYHLLSLSGAAAASVVAPSVLAGQRVRVAGLRLSASDEMARVVFDLEAPVGHEVFTLESPPRVVVDLEDAVSRGALTSVDIPGNLIRKIRHSPRHRSDLRVVLDLSRAVEPRTFTLGPNGRFGHRLVVDLEPASSQRRRPIITAEPEQEGLREVVVAIDPGHGGRDPGAIGSRGTQEKDVVLQIARRLERLINGQHGMRAVLTRSGDHYLGLRERIRKARDANADLFISVHADAARSRRPRGSSVYILSENGASSEAARWLAKRENQAGRVGGVELDDKDEVLARVLLDLSQSAAAENGLALADDVLAELERVNEVRSEDVEKAGFVVLKSPDIPSVLVETAFISNPSEERRLRTASFQQSMAVAMLRGVQRYFQDHAPPGTILAEGGRSEHVIQRGDTLSKIARQYRVSLGELRAVNDLESDRIRVGQILTIPGSDNT